jgi:hypothetical protein
MKLATIALAAAFALSGSFAYAQTKPGSPEKQPSSSAPTYDTSGMGHSKSGSGTSTSGGSDANGDQGRDKMPQSDTAVKPAPGKPDIPDPTNKK